jgi:hypothetical protein
MHIGYWWESQKEREHYEGQDVSGRIIKVRSRRKGNIGKDELD